MSPRLVKQFTFSVVLLVSSAAVTAGFAIRADTRGAKSDAASNVRAAMKNVNFHLTDRIVVYVSALEGKVVPTQDGKTPVFDDKRSFLFDVDSASIVLSMPALTNDLNDYVFAQPGAPLKKLNASIKGDELVVKGLLTSKGGIPFESDGTLSVTSDGLIRVHTSKVKAAGIPVKGLMDLLGIDTKNVVDTKKVEGVTFDKDDLILNPAELLPPPQIRGHLTSIRLTNGAIALTFGSGQPHDLQAATTSGCTGKNFIAFKGGSVRFGKLTMNDTELELIDTEPAGPFDFSLDHYMDQLAAGYSKTTPQGGLCAHVPDFDKVKVNSKPRAQ
jgi:hypothetical protein